MAGINTYGNTMGSLPQDKALKSKMGVQSPISFPKTPATPVIGNSPTKENPNPYGIRVDLSPVKTPAQKTAAQNPVRSIYGDNGIQVGKSGGADYASDKKVLGSQNTTSTTGLLGGGTTNTKSTSTSNEPGSLNLNPAPTPATPYPGAQSGSFAGNLNAVAGASNLGNNQMYNDQYNKASQNLNKIYAGQENAATAPYAGTQNNLNDQTTKELGTSYSNIFRPQSTDNLQGETSLLNTQFNQGINANTRAQQYALGEQQLAQTGASDIASLTAPGQRSYSSTLYNPANGQDVGGGQGGAFAGGQQLGNVALGQQYAANNAAHQQSVGIKNTIQQYLNSNPGLNPTDSTYLNSIAQWGQGKQLGDPKYQTLMNYLNEYTNTLAPILGVGGDPTNLKTEIAQSFVNARASGQSISQVLDSIDSLAQQKLQAMQAAGTNSTGGSTGGGSSIFDF